MELRQQFEDSAGNIAGQDYQRFTSVLLAREEERGSPQLRRLLVEWLRPAATLLIE